jgi:hypothetical protein
MLNNNTEKENSIDNFCSISLIFPHSHLTLVWEQKNIQKIGKKINYSPLKLFQAFLYWKNFIYVYIGLIMYHQFILRSNPLDLERFFLHNFHSFSHCIWNYIYKIPLCDFGHASVSVYWEVQKVEWRTIIGL